MQLKMCFLESLSIQLNNVSNYNLPTGLMFTITWHLWTFMTGSRLQT